MAELAKRQRLPAAVASLEATLFGPQRAFVEDPAPRVVTHTGRRGGKTHGLGARILRVAKAFPKETIPVFERTQTCEAARVLWKALQDLNERFGLGATFHHSRLIMTLPNKAEVVIMGADTAEACDKARGGRYPAVFIDEAGTLRPHILRYLLDEVLAPALLDYGGTLTMAGTPKGRKQGAFWDACAPGTTWSVHHWDFLENEALPLPPVGVGLTTEERRAWRERALAAELLASGHSLADSVIQREWLGNWVDDDDSLIYRVGALNHRDEHGGPLKAPALDRPGWHYTIGLDVGWNDPCAFVVVGWRYDAPDLWVLESFQEQHLLPDAVAAHLERLRLRYANANIIMDAGSHGGKIMEEQLAKRHGIRVVAARKRGKFDHIAFMNADLVSGRLRIVERTNQDLLADLYALRYAPPLPDGTVEDREHPADDNHLPDATLYAVTAISGIRKGLGDADPHAVGSKAWVAERERKLLALDDAAARRTDTTTAGLADALLG